MRDTSSRMRWYVASSQLVLQLVATRGAPFVIYTLHAQRPQGVCNILAPLVLPPATSTADMRGVTTEASRSDELVGVAVLIVVVTAPDGADKGRDGGTHHFSSAEI